MGETRRKFGNIRKLPSGRFQSRYRGPDGLIHTAPETFITKRDADRWLVLREAEIHRGDWTNPDAGKVLFGAFSTQWIDDRVLKHRTELLYRGLLKNHLAPTFGNCKLSDIKEADVRRWRKERLGVVGQSTVEGLPAPEIDPEHGGGGRVDPQEPVSHQGRGDTGHSGAGNDPAYQGRRDPGPCPRAVPGSGSAGYLRKPAVE
ncbi:N-terminal phage integrase SAM-like domain-containing protein [Streptosporangium canum]|uniref:N-terminal phage integrase SAM-like domain-containing protein n=1 Tax=Streptosporangium canum TaxID=324952 RepID=UPI00379A2D92